MPPKRKAGEAEAEVIPKKVKLNQEVAAVAANGQPTNKTIPEVINFPPKATNSVRISSWNVCGFAASQKKGSAKYIQAEDADILILTETKINNTPMDLMLSAQYPHSTWSFAEKKGYSGTSILSKIKPLSVETIIPGHPDPAHVKGRIVTLEFEACFVVGTYVTNAGQALKTLDAKKLWNTHFTAYIRSLDAKKPVIWMGDLNVAPTAIDLSNPKPNWNKTAGFTKDETEAFSNILNTGTKEKQADPELPKFVDIWRQLHPEEKHWTYWSYRFNCRSNGTGWRLDHAVLSERLVEKVKTCEIRSEIYGPSDHCPLTLELSVDLFEPPAPNLTAVLDEARNS